MEEVNEMIELVQSSKGRDMALYSGYQHYLKRRNKNGSINWSCVNRNKCSGSVTTENNKIVSINKHTCLPDEPKVEVLKRLDKCKKRVREELIPIPKIFDEEFSDLKNTGLDFVTKVPLFSNKKSTLYRNRHQALGFSSFQRLEHFLTIDDENGEDRMLTFRSKDTDPKRLKKLQAEKASAGLESEPSTSSATTDSFDVKQNSNDLPIEPTPPEFITTQCEETTDSNASVEFLPETEEPPLPPQPRQKRPNYCVKEMKTFCRLCLNPASKNQMVCLGDFHDINYPSRTVQFKRNKILQTEMYLRMIRMLMPNFDHDLVYNPIMCNDCSTRLQMASDFVEQCMATQKLIQQYKDTYCPTESMVTCEDVVQNKCQISSSPSPSTSPGPPPNPKKRKTTKPPGVTPVPQPPEIISTQHIETPEFVQIKREELEETESGDNNTYELTSVDIGNIKQEMEYVDNVVIKTNVEITENDLPIYSIVKSEPSDNIVRNSRAAESPNIPADVKPYVSTTNVPASVPLDPPASVQYSPPLQPIVPETFVSLVNPLPDPVICTADLKNPPAPANQNG